MRDSAGEARTTFCYGALYTDVQVLADKLELIDNSFVRTQDVVCKTCLKRKMIETDDDDDNPSLGEK